MDMDMEMDIDTDMEMEMDITIDMGMEGAYMTMFTTMNNGTRTWSWP